MSGPVRLPLCRSFLALFALFLVLSGCSTSSPAAAGAAKPSSPRTATAEAPTRPGKFLPTSPGASPISAAPRADGPIMLGIDVLAAQNFAPLAGKRIGLFTHPAGVNRFGVSTVDILRRAPNVRLVSLFAPEHGIYGNIPANQEVVDTVDRRTGLPVYSLHGKIKKPSPAQLRDLDVLVVDLQDIGVRSYTFATWMKYAMEACFEAHKEIVVLDRPNPLGGWKVDGPMLDAELMSDVGGFQVPYVHGLTIGELARLAYATPGVLRVSDAVRRHGKLTVIPMRGWRRSMRWPETGLTFIPTSPYVPDFPACVGYAMTGLGCQIGPFTHGIGTQYPFRGLFYPGRPVDQIQRELEALHVPGLGFRKVSATKSNGQAAIGIYVEVNDWDDWHPTELSFYLMRLTCKLSGTNPFAKADAVETRRFNIHTGSLEFWKALERDGARVDVEKFFAQWQRQAAAFQKNSRQFWLYN
jgi:uncharacterized protein YbbC (DUF1343 family)